MHLQVKMPQLPVRQGPARTRIRIGRNVAALFGIPGHPNDSDAGAGRSWVTSYSELTKEELALGGPRQMKHAAPEVVDAGVYAAKSSTQPRDHVVAAGLRDDRHGWGEVGGPPISQTLLGGFGPDQKAAVILTGVNEVLRPLASAMRTVLCRMDFPDPRLLIGTTAMVLSEAYRSQPLLMQAGMQAVGVQRSYLHEFRTAVLSDEPTDEHPWHVSRSDLPWVKRLTREDRTHDKYPDRLDLLFDVWSSLMSPDSQRSLQPVSPYNRRVEQAMDTSQIGHIFEHALEEICSSTADIVFGRLGVLGGTRIVLQQRSDGSFTPDFPGVATRPARLLTDMVLGRYFDETPYRELEAGEMPVPKFDPERCLTQTDPLTQRVMLWAYHCCERFIVSGAWSEVERDARSFPARTQQRLHLAQTAESIFGQQDALARQLWAYAASYEMEISQRASRKSGSARRALKQDIARFERRVEDVHTSHSDGRLLDSHLVETLHPLLIDLRAVVDCVVMDSVRKQAQTILESNWLSYIRVQMGLLDSPSNARRSPQSIIADLAAPGAAQDRVLRGLLESSPGLGMGVSGFSWSNAMDLSIDIQANIVERRREIFSHEGDWPPLRQALVDQITVMVQALDETPPSRDPQNQCSVDKATLLRLLETNVRALLDEERRQRDLDEVPVILNCHLEGLDLIGVLLADYLIAIQSPDLIDREVGGLQHDIVAGLQRFHSLIRWRLQSELWHDPQLAEHRNVIEKAIGE